jgi:hypothetical protein
MFSALKKLTHRSPDAGVNNGSAIQASPNGASNGINAMNLVLQRKFAKGVNYNLKLIIKGDRNTGKSCLLKRLQVLEVICKVARPDHDVNCSRVESLVRSILQQMKFKLLLSNGTTRLLMISLK